VSHAGKAFNENGELVDEQVREQLREFNRNFVEFLKN
jgi:hypothetical protein